MSLLLSVNSNNIKASTDMFTCSSDGAFSPRCLFYNITDLRKRSPKSLNLVRIEKLTILPKAAYQSSFFIALGDDNDSDLFTMRLTLFDCINIHDCIKCGFFLLVSLHSLQHRSNIFHFQSTYTKRREVSATPSWLYHNNNNTNYDNAYLLISIMS